MALGHFPALDQQLFFVEGCPMAARLAMDESTPNRQRVAAYRSCAPDAAAP
jgi:hypothetical protein